MKYLQIIIQMVPQNGLELDRKMIFYQLFWPQVSQLTLLTYYILIKVGYYL